MKKINEMKFDKNHKVRMYYNGVRQKDIYPHLTNWEVFKLKMKRFFRKVFLFIFWSGVIACVVLIVREVSPKIEYKEKEVVRDNLSEKIEELKWSLINQIWDKERMGKTEKDALITWDPNPKNPKVEIASVGTCQFKTPTVIYYEKKLYNVDMSRYDAIMLSLSDEKCKDLMYDIVFKDEKGWQNWLNSCDKVGCKEKLLVIKELEN